MSATLGLYISRGFDDNQWWGNIDDGTGTHYTFAHLKYTTTSITSRLNYTMTPNLSFQAYLNPFVSTGKYTNWRELSSTPRAEDYDARYVEYTGDHDNDPTTPLTRNPGGIRFLSFNSNAVLRWEYRPGSTLFFVWSHGRQEFTNRSTEFQFSREYRDLMGLHPNNTFLIKGSYWLSL
jgi:hypothetical protein